MKKTLFAVAALMAAGCASDSALELPLTQKNGYGPFKMAFGGVSVNSDNPDNRWYNTYLKVSGLPDGLSDLKTGSFDTNFLQTVYQNHADGNIGEEFFNSLQKSWRWTPDTVALTKQPVRTRCAFAYGKDNDGRFKLVVDTDNDLDLSDETPFVPVSRDAIRNSVNADSTALANTIDVKFEVWRNGKTEQVTIPVLVVSSANPDAVEEPDYMCNFAQYAEAEYKGTKIAVATEGHTRCDYSKIVVTTMPDDGAKAKDEFLARNGNYIRVKDELFKIKGVNTYRNVLELERVSQPESELRSNQVGFKAFDFEGKDLITGNTVTSAGLSGKYVLVDFWATWCGPCRAEFQNLKDLYSKTDRSDFEIVAIAGNSTGSNVRKTVEEAGLPWIQLLADKENNLLETYGVIGYPTTFLLDRNGVIIARNLRGRKLEDKVNSLLGE